MFGLRVYVSFIPIPIQIPILTILSTLPNATLFCTSYGFKKEERFCRSVVENGDGLDKRTSNNFECHISLTIPAYGAIELTGDPQPDKKTSLDSAALLMLYELQRLRKVKIG